jgi:hypothetical protein
MSLHHAIKMLNLYIPRLQDMHQIGGFIACTLLSLYPNCKPIDTPEPLEYANALAGGHGRPRTSLFTSLTYTDTVSGE